MTPHLCALEGEFDLDVARLLADPEEDVVSVVEDHHVIVCEVVLSSEDHHGNVTNTWRKPRVFSRRQVIHVREHWAYL